MAAVEPTKASASIRFRLIDGTDIGPKTFPLTSLVSAVKEAVLAEWPQTKDGSGPANATELKLILAGRVLDNEATLADARTPASELCTMHVVYSPKQPAAKAKEEPKDGAGDPKCTCTIQ